MEQGKLSKLKGMLLMFLPKTASAVTFQSPPISPRKANPGKAISVPAASLIPKDARRRQKNGSFDAREPGSPMVSCIGQVKNKKKKTRLSRPNRQDLPPMGETRLEEKRPKEVKKNGNSSPKFQLFKTAKRGQKSDTVDKSKPSGLERVPSLANVKKFASGRGALSNFDWRDHGAAVVPDCSDDEEIEGVKKKIIPHSAPIVLHRNEIVLEPKKEINLWKRRTTAPPPPLQL
ncbi:hypothetical protein BT93_J1882 [Corymbia citriodora subsp. variegata]|nr:hypothetical protein BT93_J1882 [Corymbia citriodora subsp. variegata]